MASLFLMSGGGNPARQEHESACTHVYILDILNNNNNGWLLCRKVFLKPTVCCWNFANDVSLMKRNGLLHCDS